MNQFRINSANSFFHLIHLPGASPNIVCRLTEYKQERNGQEPGSEMAGYPMISYGMGCGGTSARKPPGPLFGNPTRQQSAAGKQSLGGEPDLVRLVHHGEKALKAKIAHRPRTLPYLAEPTVQSVSKGFTRAIEQRESNIAAMNGLPSAASYGRTCVAPTHISTGPEKAESSRE